MNKEKQIFLQNLSVFYNGNLGMLAKEDCVALASNLMAENGYESIIATVNTMGIPSLKSPEDRHTLPEVKIHNFKSTIAYFRFMNKYKTATVLGNARTFIGLTACYFGNYRVFMNHHSTLPKKAWQRMILKFFLKRYDAIRADTQAEKRELLKLGGLDPKRILISPIPIDHKYFSKKSRPEFIKELKKKYDIKPKDKTFIFLAALRMHKRPDTVLKAVKILKEKGHSIKLLQVGKDTLKEQTGKSFLEMAKDLGLEKEAISTGRVSDEELHALFHLGDIGIQSSDVEGQCITAFEYAAAALPECLSDIPSFEIFKNNILRHKSSDYKKLAENLEFYMSNPKIAKEHATKNQKMVQEEYDYDKVKEKLKLILIDKKEELKKSKR